MRGSLEFITFIEMQNEKNKKGKKQPLECHCIT